MKVASFRMDGGLITDVPQVMVPPNCWTAMSNFRVSQQNHQGYATRIRGYAAYGAACNHDVGPQFGLNINLLGAASRTATNYLWYGGLEYATGYARIGQQTGGVDSDVTPAGWTGAGDAAPGRWTGGLLNNFVPVLNDQTHVPVYWDYLVPGWQNLPNYNPTGAGTGSWTALRPYREFLVGMGLLISGGFYRSDTVYWSNASVYNMPPDTWVAAATNQAGDAVAPGGGEIVDGAVLGEDFIFYKKFASYRMRYVGGNYVMDVRPLWKGWGLHSQNCVQEYAGKHYVFTGDDLIVHDGQRWESLLYGKWRANITNPSPSSFLWIDRLNREMWLCLGTGSGLPSVAIVVDMDTGKIARRNLPSISGMIQEDQKGLSSPIGCYAGNAVANSGSFYDFASGNTNNGTDITASIFREALDFGDPSKVKLVKWVRPIITAGSSQVITVEAGGTKNVDDSVSYSTAVTFTASTDDKADIFAEGRWLNFRFGSTGAVDSWGIAGFDVGYELRGDY